MTDTDKSQEDLYAEIETLRARVAELEQAVAERQQAAGTLQESEKFFRIVFEQAAVGISQTDSQTGQFTMVNQRYCDMVGYTREELLARTFQELTHPDDLQAGLDYMHELREGKIHEFSMEKRFLCKDGSIIWANLTVYPTWRVGEEPNYYIAIIEDITERKRAEGALLESEIEHKILIHNIPGMVYRGYPDWSAEIFSSSEELCGYQPDELNAREGGWLSLVHPDDRERIHKEGAELVQKQKRIVQTYRIIDKSAKVRWVEDRKTSLFSEDGAFIGIDGIVLDITERKKAERALRASEERLRQIASSLREVIWLRDAQNRQVLYANPAFEELTGWTCESFYENPDIVIDATHPDDKEWVIKALDQRFEGVLFDKEHRIIHLDGSVRWVSSQSFPVRNEAGEVYRWATIMEDITERKRAEEALSLLDKARSAMARELDLPKVIRDIVESIAETFGYTLVSLYLLEDDVLRLQHQVGYEDVIPEIPITKGVMGRVVRTGKPILLRDVNADPDCLRATEGIVSEVCVPLFSEGEVAGVLNVEGMKEQVLSEADLQLMIALSEHVNIWSLLSR
jgi:PAS domain S-box-containing protein